MNRAKEAEHAMKKLRDVLPEVSEIPDEALIKSMKSVFAYVRTKRYEERVQRKAAKEKKAMKKDGATNTV